MRSGRCCRVRGSWGRAFADSSTLYPSRSIQYVLTSPSFVHTYLGPGARPMTIDDLHTEFQRLATMANKGTAPTKQQLIDAVSSTRYEDLPLVPPLV